MTLPFRPPTFLSAEFVLSPVTEADVDGVVSAHQAAFHSPSSRCWWAPDLAAMRAFHSAGLKKGLASPDKRRYKITCRESGEVVAVATWALPKGFRGLGEGPTGGAEAEQAGGAESKDDPENDGLLLGERARNVVEALQPPEGANRKILACAIESEMRIHEEHGADSMLNLALLYTVPRYERRGLSRALVEPVLAVAQAEGVAVWVDSSEAGLGFYERLGFVAVECYKLDMSGGYNVTGTQTVTGMKWEPKRV